MSVVALPRFRLSYDNAEALKWLAFACMLVDHVNMVFFARELDWATPVGRVAMPVFAFLVGRHLDSPRVLKRLVVVGALSMVPYAWALHGGDLLPLNILLTFAVAAGIWYLVRKDLWPLALGLFLFGSLFVEYAWPGVALVLASWWWWHCRSPVSLVGIGVALLALCTVNGNAWGFLAVPVVLAASWCDWRVPRVRHFFWVGYPAHLAVIAAVVALGV